MNESQFSDKIRVRVCAVIVQNSSILLAKINSPTRPDPIRMPPGGGVEMGETLEQALHRELSEETGLLIEKKQLLWIHEFIDEPYHAVEFYFRCEVTGGRLKKGIDPELEAENQILLGLSFVPLKDVQELPVEPQFIKEFCKKGGNFFRDVRHRISSPPGNSDK